MRLNADMQAARHVLATVAIRIIPLALLLATILLAGCDVDGGGY